MIAARLATIAAAIKAKQTYFDSGYSDVYLDPQRGYIHNAKPIFPNDTKGDYFYLRMPRAWQFTNTTDGYIADGITPLAVSGQIVLVACVKDADPDILLQNLINQLQSQGCAGNTLTVTAALSNGAEVIVQELANVEQRVVDSALQNHKRNMTIVSISFTYNAPYPYNSCVVNPCKC